MINAQYKDILTNEEKGKELARKILETGHVELTNALNPEVAEKLRLLMDDRSYGNKKGEGLKGTIAYDLMYSDDIFNFCEALHKGRCAVEGKKYVPLKREKQLVGFPYKDGRGGAKNKRTKFHYDGAYTNILYPIVLPKDPDRAGGKLVIFPNLRQKYSGLIGKIFARMLRHSKAIRKMYGYREVTYTVGSFHLFFGDVSFHGVEPITEGERVVMTINSHW